jgi:hypothetical protein
MGPVDQERIVRTVREATFEVYQLGMCFKGARMIPPAPQRCVEVQAGPLRFLVEPRHLDDAAVATLNGETLDGEGTQTFDDFGPSLHVLSAVDGLEYLRFDCFDDKPHYHYARHAEDENITVRIDQIAEGDPVDFALRAVRGRLPEMLDYAGAVALASEVRQEWLDIDTALESVVGLMRDAGTRANSEHVSTVNADT